MLPELKTSHPIQPGGGFDLGSLVGWDQRIPRERNRIEQSGPRHSAEDVQLSIGLPKFVAEIVAEIVQELDLN